jgi:hypothetical protein
MWAGFSRSIAIVATLLVFALVGLPQAATAQFVQQDELVGSGATEDAFQGSAVGLSADGNTALVGGWGDDR